MAVGKMQLKLKLKKIYERVTRNRLTAVFFLFALFHCFAQGIIQSLLFVIDTEYYTLLSDITAMAKIPPQNHTDLVFVHGGYVLRMCNYIPHNNGDCYTIFDSRTDIPSATFLDSSSAAQNPEFDAQLRGEIIVNALNDESFKISTNITSFGNISSGNETQVIFQANDGDQVDLNATCTSMLLYPFEHFQNSRREDIAFVGLQFWLFFISVIAMMYDSVPHVLTVLVTRVTLTAWSIYAVWRTEYQQVIFDQMIATPGTACSVALFGQYFSTRILFEIPDLILNCTALGISAFLSWSLFRAYNNEVFTYVGAPKKITKMYKYFLALQVCLQLEVYVLVTAAALWADQLFTTYISEIAFPEHIRAYEALIIFYVIVLIPWIVLAWHGIRYEKRLVTMAFLFAGTCFLIGSVIMFISNVYTWTYYAWPCFGCFTTASLILILSTDILGLVCLRNFGKGLSQYLYAESNLSSSNFAPEVFVRDVESTYVDDEKLKASGLHADFTTHYLPALGPTTSRDSY